MSKDGPSDKCSKCGATLYVGSWPYCRGNPADHDTVRSKRAQSFQPTFYARNPSTGEIRFLAHKNAKIPKGYQREAITTLHEADKFMKEVNQREDAKAQEAAYHEGRYWKEAYAANAAELERRARSFHPITRQYAEEAVRKMRTYEGPRPKDSNFYIEPFVYDSGNRESFCNEDTGWRERKD